MAKQLKFATFLRRFAHVVLVVVFTGARLRFVALLRFFDDLHGPVLFDLERAGVSRRNKNGRNTSVKRESPVASPVVCMYKNVSQAVVTATR